MCRMVLTTKACSEEWLNKRPAIQSGCIALFKQPSCGFARLIPHMRFTCHMMDVVDVCGNDAFNFGLLLSSKTQEVWYSWLDDIAAQWEKKICGKGVVLVVSTACISDGRCSDQLASCSHS